MPTSDVASVGRVEVTTQSEEKRREREKEREEERERERKMQRTQRAEQSADKADVRNKDDRSRQLKFE